MSRKDAPPRSTGAARVASMLAPKVSVKKEKIDEEEDEERKVTTDDGLIIIDTTSEFCRQIGEEDFSVDKGNTPIFPSKEIFEKWYWQFNYSNDIQSITCIYIYGFIRGTQSSAYNYVLVRF